MQGAGCPTARVQLFFDFFFLCSVLIFYSSKVGSNPEEGIGSVAVTAPLTLETPVWKAFDITLLGARPHGTEILMRCCSR